jgi:acyl-CoA thioester hydrolase
VKAASRLLEDYPLQTHDKLRYGDTDRQGHINNAVFATLFETGRVDFLFAPAMRLLEPGTSFVIARIVINYLAEMHWPGRIDTGTRVAAIGRSSITLEQALFQDGVCVAAGESTIVLTKQETRRSHPLPEDAVARLKTLMGTAG